MLMTACLLMIFAFQDEIEQTQIDEFSISDRFSEAVSKYNSVERSDSEKLFDKILLELGTKSALLPEERKILIESLKYMGALTFPTRSNEFFTQLIKLDPDQGLNSRDFPPKIVDVYQKLRNQLAGKVRVTALDITIKNPLDGAVLWADGKEVGTIVGEKVFAILSGTHQLEIRCPNYDTYTQPVTILGGSEVVIRAELTRNAAQVVIATNPRDCAAKLNGKLIGTTTQEPPSQYQEQLLGTSLSLSDLGVLVIDNLKPGAYTLELSRPCFRNRIFKFDVTRLGRTTFKPILMEPSKAHLTVKAVTKSEGLVFLGTERLGYLPLENHPVCPGDYVLRVTFPDGEFLKNITIKDADSPTFMAEPLPSIAWLGLEDEKEGVPPGDIKAWLNGLKRWNVQMVDVTRFPVNPFPILFQNEDEGLSDQAMGAMTSEVPASLYMAARVVRKKVVIRNVEVAFWTPLSRKPEIRSFDFREFEKFRELVAQLDVTPALTKPWLGIQVGRMRNQEGVEVLEVHSSGPLAGKVKVGDVITALDGNLVRGPRELESLANLNPVSLEINGATVKVTPIATIAEVPFGRNGAPHAYLAMFEKLGKYHEDDLVRKSALFNQARFQLLMGDSKQAFDIFSTLTLDTDYGINQGTLFFYQGLCFRGLKLRSEATTAFTNVQKYPGATLFDAYGPKAIYWAESELENPD